MIRTVLYLHGFLSGPGSKKACMLRDLCAQKGVKFVAPDLNTAPDEAARIIQAAYDGAREEGGVAVAGASLGGFYAAWIAARTGMRAALLNPAVAPWEIVRHYNGEYKSFTGDKTVRVTPEYAGLLREMDGKILFTADAHRACDVAFGYAEAVELACRCGFDTFWRLTEEGFVPAPLHRALT